MSALATTSPTPATTNDNSDNIVTTTTAAPTACQPWQAVGPAHPLFAQQVALEIDMLQIGAEAFKRFADKSMASDNATRLAPVRKLLANWLDPLAAAIKVYANPPLRRGRPEPARALLRGFDEGEVARTTLTIMLDGISGKGGNARTLQKLASTIGNAVQDISRLSAWAAHNPGLLHAYCQKARERGQTEKHHALALRIKFNGQVKADIPDWHDWSRDDVIRAGGVLLTLACDASGGAFRLVNVNTAQNRLVTVLEPHAETVAWLEACLDRTAILRPFRLPTCIPPQPWAEGQAGGYWSNIIRPLRLINGRGATKGYDYSALFPALNILQSTAFRINANVFRVASAMHAIGSPCADFPTEQPWPIPDRLPEGTPRDEWQQRNKVATAAHEHNRKRSHAINQPRRVLAIVEKHLAGLDAVHFPHNADFRGRLSVASQGMTSQGGDLEKGLLEFEQARPIDNQEAADWLFIECANRFDQDKQSFEARVRWTLDHKDMLIAIADDPTGRRGDWQGLDDKWQALAAALEVARFWREGFGMASHLVVRVDGTANGLQHLSAMLRDEEGGRAVNLLPPASATAGPSDIYALVADLLPAQLRRVADGRGYGTTAFLVDDDEADEAADEADEACDDDEGAYDEEGLPVFDDADGLDADAGDIEACKPSSPTSDETRAWARFWLEHLAGKSVRSLAKVVTMTLPYGATTTGNAQAIRHALAKSKELNPKLATIKEEMQASLVLARCLRLCAEQVVTAAPRASAYLQAMAKLAKDAPISFTTATGIDVECRVMKTEAKRKAIGIGASKARPQVLVETGERNMRKEATSIIANFVQAQDGAHLHRVLAKAEEAGIGSLTAVHDAVGTHAADMSQLQGIIREAFAWLHKGGNTDLLQDFHRQAMEAIPMADRHLAPAPPAQGELDMERVKEGIYLFN